MGFAAVQIGQDLATFAKAEIIANRDLWEKVHAKRLEDAGAQADDVTMHIDIGLGGCSTKVFWKNREVFSHSIEPIQA